MTDISRRDFLKMSAAASAAILLEETEAAARTGAFPRRVLGRTGQKVSVIGVGMAPMGIERCKPEDCEGVVNEALDAGINYIDVAPNYGDAEQKLGPVVSRRRDEIFLVTKVEEQSKDGVLRQIRESLKRMKTDRLDAVHLHNIGDFDIAQTFGKEGAMEGLRQAQKAGLIRFCGMSGHMRPMKFVEGLRTGEIDLIMPAVNYVDRHTYNFEEKVLPEAVKRKTGIVAMKVLGGAANFQYDPPREGLLSGARYALAVRYALSLPGMCTAVIGVKDAQELSQAIQAGKSFRPLNAREKAFIEKEGSRMAKEWGEHFGPSV